MCILGRLGESPSWNHRTAAATPKIRGASTGQAPDARRIATRSSLRKNEKAGWDGSGGGAGGAGGGGNSSKQQPAQSHSGTRLSKPHGTSAT